MDEELHIQICRSSRVDSEDVAEVGAGAYQDVGDIRPHNRYGPWTRAPGRPRRSRLDWEYATLEPLKDYDGPSAEDIRTTTEAYADNAKALKEDSPRGTIASPERALEQPSLHSATGKSPSQPRSTMTPRSTPSQPFLDVSPNAATKDHKSRRRGALSRQTSRAAPQSYAAHPCLWRCLQASSGGNRGPRLDNTGTRRAQSTSTAPRYPRLFQTRLAQHAFFHGGLIA